MPDPADVIDLTNLESDTDTQGSDDDNELPLDDLSRTHLHVAIACVPELRLREVLAELVDSDPVVGRALFNKLVVIQGKDEGEEINEGDEGDESEGESDGDPPVLVPRRETCAKCDEEYDASTSRVHGECRYHPGTLNVSYASFVDWDEDVHGEMDTPSNRREFPENFNWTCCKEDGTTEGCEEEKHQPGGPRRKRPRYS